MKLELKATKRTRGPDSKLLMLRKNGQVPGIIYGLKKEPISIAVSHIDLIKLAATQKPNHIITITFDGGEEEVLIHTLAWHKVKIRTIDHVDFIRVDADHPVIVKVPVKTEGLPVGVKMQGGQFNVMKRFVKVKCKAKDIPESFTHDISELAAGKVFYTRDIQFPQGKVLTPAKTALYGVTRGRKKEEEEAAKADAAKAAAPKAAAAAPKADAAKDAKKPDAKKPEAKKK